MIKSVLVPYDGSNCSKSALSIAGSIAGLVGARVHGLFVDDIKAYSEIGVGQLLAASIVGSPAVPSPRSAEVVLKLEEQYESRLKLLKEEFRLVCTPGMLEGMFYSRIGDPAREIVEMAKTVDFVVIGHDSGSEFHAGRTSVDLLRTTTRPVLVVPCEPKGDEKILVAYDKSDASARVLRAAAELAEIADLGAVHLLTIDEDEEEAVERQSTAAQYLSHYDFEVTPVIRSGRPADVIREYADEIDASIVALGSFGHNRLHERIFGSTTFDILSKLDRAVLLMA